MNPPTQQFVSFFPEFEPGDSIKLVYVYVCYNARVIVLKLNAN